jgi:hypothetical protein
MTTASNLVRSLPGWNRDFSRCRAYVVPQRHTQSLVVHDLAVRGLSRWHRRPGQRHVPLPLVRTMRALAFALPAEPGFLNTVQIAVSGPFPPPVPAL